MPSTSCYRCCATLLLIFRRAAAGWIGSSRPSKKTAWTICTRCKTFGAEPCVYPELTNHWADELLPVIQRAWSDRSVHFVICPSSICLSCLLEAGRYEELAGLLALQSRFWPNDKFWAEALKRQGRIDEAIQYAESLLGTGSYEQSILAFCETALLDAGHEDEAYRRYGLYVRAGNIYLSQFRALKKRYPGRDPRQMLLDLIESSPMAADWFAAARQSGTWISPCTARVPGW